MKDKVTPSTANIISFAEAKAVLEKGVEQHNRRVRLSRRDDQAAPDLHHSGSKIESIFNEFGRDLPPAA